MITSTNNISIPSNQNKNTRRRSLQVTMILFTLAILGLLMGALWRPGMHNSMTKAVTSIKDGAIGIGLVGGGIFFCESFHIAIESKSKQDAQGVELTKLQLKEKQ